MNHPSPQPAGDAPAGLRCGRCWVAFRRAPLVMGVLNVTPDSFSDGGRHLGRDAAVRRAHEMAAEGADLIDVGGESTRPGALPVSAQEEIDRILPVIEALCTGDAGRAPIAVPLSIDTRKAAVAEAALAAGCTMVNDVTAGADPDMVALLSRHEDVPVVLMHMRGEPRTMQVTPFYQDVVGEVTAFLRTRAGALREAGIGRERIVLDPGIGFGKRLADNLDLLKNVDALRVLGYPVLVGASRKSFLGKILDADAGERLAGSLAAAAWCHHAGVDIVRAHDVRETVSALRVLDAIADPDPFRDDR
ncbi:MAG: dihydropteroate synthase [Candidatus Krumholzibacteria bacterium]|nr:dihydropteroate synthase [Candidatus Krumholzibacteria bacterium]